MHFQKTQILCYHIFIFNLKNKVFEKSANCGNGKVGVEVRETADVPIANMYTRQIWVAGMDFLKSSADANCHGSTQVNAIHLMKNTRTIVSLSHAEGFSIAVQLEHSKNMQCLKQKHF